MSEVSTLHVPFAKHLREQRIAFVHARPDRESTICAGWPDFTLLHPKRPALLIEFKDKETAVSKVQRELHAELQGMGHTIHIVRDLNIALELLKAWLGDVPRYEPQTGVARIVVRNRDGGHGSWLFNTNTGEWLRKATIADLRAYPANEP